MNAVYDSASLCSEVVLKRYALSCQCQLPERGSKTTGIDRFYINAAVRALMSANHLFLEATIEELLLRNPNFGKRDTSGIDAIREIGIREHIGIVDPILFLFMMSEVIVIVSTS
jgi:hypothetical protein